MTANEPGLDEPHRVLALLDEFPSLTKIPQLKAGIAFLRSYQVRPIILVQHLSQLDAVYGPLDAQAFKNTKAKVVFTLNDIHEAKYFSETLGVMTQPVPSYALSDGWNRSSSHLSCSVHYQSQPLLRPEEMLRLKSHQALVLLEGQMPIRASKCYWFKDRQLQHALKPYVR